MNKYAMKNNPNKRIVRPIVPTRQMEAELIARGWTTRDRAKFEKLLDTRTEKIVEASNPPRFTYRLGEWRVLTESVDQPYWTVQCLHGDSVSWFVDFPVTVPVARVFRFIEG